MSQRRKLIQKILMYFIYVLLAVLFISPIIYVFVASLKNDDQIVSDMSSIRAFLLTGALSLDNYVTIISKVNFFKFFKNSMIVAVIFVSLSTVLNGMAGYALGMLNFKGKKVLVSLVIALSIIPTEAIIINRFIVVYKLGLLNSYLGLSLPIVGYPLYIFLYYNHFRNMPRELLEAAIVDGASYSKVFWNIMIPLSKPIISTIVIMGFIRSWGDLLWPTLATRDETYRTLPLALRALNNDIYTYWGQIFAFSSLMILPVLIIFLVFQKQFVSSLTSSGIKG